MCFYSDLLAQTAHLGDRVDQLGQELGSEEARSATLSSECDRLQAALDMMVWAGCFVVRCCRGTLPSSLRHVVCKLAEVFVLF